MKNRISSAVVIWLLYIASAATQQSPAGVVDSRTRFPPSAAQVQGRRVPKLSTLRATAFETPPVPGGIGAGTLYAPGFLRVTSRAELYTQMIVHPNGIAVPNWIFTSATNRTELTAEVVGIYIGTGASLGIYDWSCLPVYPCPNGSTEPSWQWTRDLSGLPCYYTFGDDGGGHMHDLLSYVNRSNRHGNDKGPKAPVPNWTNSVLLLNHCTGEWDLVYSHDFRATQKDCSAEGVTCGWWGPIIETFNDDPQPLINELGYLGSVLRVDTTFSSLTPPKDPDDPPDSYFVGPAGPWQVFHLAPNGSWGAGSFTGN